MHKVDSAGATAQNEFTNGDLPNNVARTRLEAKFMNALQRELVNLVIQAGLTLSDADDTQVLQTLTVVVPTLTALRNLPVPTVANGKQVTALTRGNAVDGDGGAAVYRWVYNDTTADNGASAIRPSTNPAQGRWLRCIGWEASNAAQLGGNAAALYALLNSPTFTGTPSGPTAAAGTNTQQLATTAFVRTAITALINSSPAALDTLAELATALGNDANFATTITNALAAKAPLASPALSGTPTAPTAAVGTNNSQLANTAHLQDNMLGGASQAYSNVLASRAFGVTYTNTTGRPILLMITVSMGTNTNVELYMQSTLIAKSSNGNASGVTVPFTAVIFPGHTYGISSVSGSNTLLQWWEMR